VVHARGESRALAISSEERAAADALQPLLEPGVALRSFSASSGGLSCSAACVSDHAQARGPGWKPWVLDCRGQRGRAVPVPRCASVARHADGPVLDHLRNAARCACDCSRSSMIRAVEPSVLRHPLESRIARCKSRSRQVEEIRRSWLCRVMRA
jgi:hypothetical protein